jgi:predicted Zn-dependent protease
MMRLPALFAVDVNSPEYNELSRASVFYAESCLLVHMLMLGDRYALKFPDFLDRLSASNSAQTAFGDVYGKSLGEVERDMVSYFQETGNAAYAAPVQRTEAMSARPATGLEIDLTLAKVTGLLGRLEEARKRLDRMSAAHEANPEIEEAQAYIAWRSGDREGALRNFELVFDHGSAHWKTYWDYARLLEVTRPDPSEEIDALHKALALKPEFADARLMLGYELFIAGRCDAALLELERVKDADPRYAGTMFLLMARASAASGKDDQARQYAREAKKHALRPEEAKSMDALLHHLDHPTTEDDEDEKRPTVRYRNPGKPGQ